MEPNWLQKSVSSQRASRNSVVWVSHLWPVPFIVSVPPPRCFLAEGNLDYGLCLDQFYKSVSKPLFFSI